MERGDCMSFMRAMETGSVDHVIADPPYDSKTHLGMRNSSGAVQLDFEALSTMAHVTEMLRVARRWVICFCALEQLGQYQMFAGDAWVRAGVWVRMNSMPQQSGDRPGQGAEGVAIMWAGAGRMSWNSGGSPAVWRGPRTNCENHPTEKPEWLMEALVRSFTDYGDTILDTHAGSGTTGVAAIRLGRNFIGYEMIDKHHRTATMRLSGTREQMDLQYKKRKKSRQLKLGGNDGQIEKEAATVAAVEEEGSISGDLLGQRSGETDTNRESEGGENEPCGVVPPLANRFDGAGEEGNEEEAAPEFGADDPFA